MRICINTYYLKIVTKNNFNRANRNVVALKQRLFCKVSFAYKLRLIKRLQRERKKSNSGLNHLSHLPTESYNPIRRLNGRYILMCFHIS